MCVLSICMSELANRMRGEGKRKVDGSTATSGKNECVQRSEEQRLSHYGDIKHTSGTHIILWAIKMLGGGGMAALNVAQQQAGRS